MPRPKPSPRASTASTLADSGYYTGIDALLCCRPPAHLLRPPDYFSSPCSNHRLPSMVTALITSAAVTNKAAADYFISSVVGSLDSPAVDGTFTDDVR